MGGLLHGAKGGDKACTDAYEECANEGEAGEGFREDEGCADGVEDEAGGLQGGEDYEGKGCDLDGRAEDVGDYEEEDSDLGGGLAWVGVGRYICRYTPAIAAVDEEAAC